MTEWRENRFIAYARNGLRTKIKTHPRWCPLKSEKMKLTKNQMRVLTQLSSGMIDYSYSYFVGTVNALIRKGLVKHRPRSPRYILTKKGKNEILG